MEKLIPYPTEQDCLTQELSKDELVSTLVHELAQPLTAINAYIYGSLYRLTQGELEKEPLLNAMYKVMQHIECAEKIILSMKESLP